MSETIEDTSIADIEAVRASFLDAIAADKLSVNAAAVQVRIGSSTLALWKNGKYSGDNDEVTRKIKIWLDGRGTKARIQSMLPSDEFQPTPTSKLVLGCLEHAQYIADIVVVALPPGHGKTVACQRYTETHPQAWLMTVGPSALTPSRVLARMCAALGIREASAARRFERVVAKMRGTAGLLIVDEAQHLPLAGLEQLREVYDATGIGLALVGSPEIIAQIDGQGRESRLAMVFSRIGMRVTRSTNTARDAARIQKDASVLLDAASVDDKTVRALLSAVAAKPGALRGMNRVMRLARMRASQSDDGIMTVEDVNAAWTRLSGSSVSEVAA